MKRFSIFLLIAIILSACGSSPEPGPLGNGQGKIIYTLISSGNERFFSSLAILDLETGESETLLETDYSNDYFATSVNDQYAYYAQTTFYEYDGNTYYYSGLYSYEIATGNIRKLSIIPQTSGDEDNERRLVENLPDVSHDGRYLTFLSNRSNLTEPNKMQLHIMDLEKLTIMLVPNAPADLVWPRFSPDGTQIAFTAFDGSDWEIYTINTDGSNLTKITDNPASDRHPDWSPDGSKLVFHSDRDGNMELYIYDFETGETTRLTNNPAADATGQWSPDGKLISFHSDRGGDYDLYTINVETGEEILLLDTPEDTRAALWVP